MATVNDFLTRCYKLARIYGPGDTIDAGEMADALSTLNEMIGIFLTDGMMLYAIQDAYYSLAAQVANNPGPVAITIGPSGATITATRPERIEEAYIVLTSTNPNVSERLDVINDAEFGDIPVLNTGTSLPERLYYSPAWPNGNIYLWPYLNAAAKLHLFTWQLLDDALTLAGTFTLPPGYNEMMRFNMAERLMGEYGRPPSSFISDNARKAKAAIMSHNVRTVLQSCDPAVMGSGGNVSTWNYLTGDYNS